MARYYFLGSLLPPLELGKKPDLSFDSFLEHAKDNLTDQDMNQLAVVRRYIDIQNLRAFWQEKPLDKHGNFYSEKQFEEALFTEEGFPSYVFEFLETYDTLEKRLELFPMLVASFFQEEIQRAKSYLKEYLIFERELRLVLVGFRAKIVNRDVSYELRHENPADPVVAQIIAQKDSEVYEPPIGYEDLKEIFQNLSSSPLELHRAISQYRLDRYDSLMDYDVFDIDHILCYMVKLIVVENWLQLSQDAGLEILDRIIKEN